MSVILKAEDISKQYRLGLVGSGTLSDDFKRWWYGIRGLEDPFLKVGAVNDRSSRAKEDYVWALKDVNFEVKQGEVLGIIGKNGAGKSTLLKILSRVTSPTTGSIKSKGRIASLLEIGTGFHAELTGRENIFMNGAVLGMTKTEIKRKLDEIVDFSGCEMYIDTPVKRYSSGMTVRLGFAVAAHLEPEILVVDEVLAVGDAEFQKKAIGKMRELSNGEGRTVLFVSHNMVSIQRLCSRCIVLDQGEVLFEGDVEKAITKYLVNEIPSADDMLFPIKTNFISIESFCVRNIDREEAFYLFTGSEYSLQLIIKNLSFEEINLDVRFQIFDEKDDLISTLNTFHTNNTFLVRNNDIVEFICRIPKLPIVSGEFRLGLEILNRTDIKVLYENAYFSRIKIAKGDFYKSGRIPTSKNLGKIFLDFDWSVSLSQKSFLLNNKKFRKN